MKTNVVALPLLSRPTRNEGELAAAQRFWLEEQQRTHPPRMSSLIAALSIVDDPLEREIILQQLERKP